MLKICEKCNCTMSFDPYFKAYICRQCGNEKPVSKNDRRQLLKKNAKFSLASK